MAFSLKIGQNLVEIRCNLSQIDPDLLRGFGEGLDPPLLVFSSGGLTACSCFTAEALRLRWVLVKEAFHHLAGLEEALHLLCLYFMAEVQKPLLGFVEEADSLLCCGSDGRRWEAYGGSGGQRWEVRGGSGRVAMVG
ncbi:hypothetical protein ACOSP7_026506 [Xanthoceras sorbifolium]